MLIIGEALVSGSMLTTAGSEEKLLMDVTLSPGIEEAGGGLLGLQCDGSAIGL